MNKFLFLLLLPLCLGAEQLQVDLVSESAILINADTGAVLYEKRAYEPFYPASITKVATAYYALKTNKERLGARIPAQQEAIASITEEAIRRSNYTLPSHWVEFGSSHIGIKRGEVLTLKDLLYGMMLRSGNDAANVIALYAGGTIPRFIADLNEECKRIGCQNTHFKNPHGLHHPDHKTTAADMALITREALKEPIFRQIVKTVRYTRPKTNLNDATAMLQSNKLLRKGPHYYQKAIGVKTGFTSDAQNTLISAAQHDGRTLIAVVLKAEERSDTYADVVKLFETAFNQPKIQKTIIKKGVQKFAKEMPSGDRLLMTATAEEVKVDYYAAEAPKIQSMITWDALELPIKEGQRVGQLHLSDVNGNIDRMITLYAATEVKPSWWGWFKQLFSGKAK